MKKYFIIILIVVLLVCLFGCKPTEKPIITPFDEIFVQNSGITPYNNSIYLGGFGDGVSPYTVKGDYSSAFLSEYNLIILQKQLTKENGVLYTGYGFFSVTKKEIVIPIIYSEFSVRYGFIIVNDTEGNCVVYNTKGEIVIPVDEGIKSDGTQSGLDRRIRAISKDYIAVQSTTVAGFCNIYKSNGKLLTKANGDELLIKALTNEIKAVDDFIIRTKLSHDSESGKKEISIFTLPSNLPNEKGFFISTAVDSAMNVFYLGNGKFYCYDVYKGDKEGYQYIDLTNEYRKANVWEYDAYTDMVTPLSLDVIYTIIINSYYAEEDGLDLDIDAYLKQGYSFVSVGLIRGADKKTTFDQFIIDSNRKIILSMVSTLGSNVIYDKNSTDYRDVLLTYISGIGFSPTTMGEMLLYDINGNLALKLDDVHSNIFYNNGIVTSKKDYVIDGKPFSYFGAYTLSGEEIFNPRDRKYIAMTAFVGEYALAEKLNNNGVSICVLVDKMGNEKALNSTVAKTKDGKFIYKAGCFVFKDIDGKYGLKNYEDIEVLEAINHNMVLAKYGIDTVIVYAQRAKDGEFSAYIIK